MRFLSHVAISSFALLAAFTMTPAAQAGSDWEFRLMMPDIFVPMERPHQRPRYYEDYSGFDDRDSDAVFEPRRRGDMVYNDDLDEWVPRKSIRHLYVYDDDLDEWVPRKRLRTRGNMVYDPTLDDWVPLYQPEKPVKKPRDAKPALKAKSASTVTTNKTAKSTITITDATTTTKKPVDKTASQVASLSKPVIKPETKAATQTASVAKSTGQKIGCTNGADIISGYGFTSVKPQTCTGTVYSYNAVRAQNAYVINLSSATGEITDVKKVN